MVILVDTFYNYSTCLEFLVEDKKLCGHNFLNGNSCRSLTFTLLSSMLSKINTIYETMRLGFPMKILSYALRRIIYGLFIKYIPGYLVSIGKRFIPTWMCLNISLYMCLYLLE